MNTNKILLGIAIALVIYLGVSSFGFFTSIKGSGNVIRETRNLETFHALEAGGEFYITVKQGTPQQVIVESDDNILPIIITKVQHGELKISTEKASIDATKMNITIVVTNINEFDISGASTIKTIGYIKSAKMEIECSGASEANMQLDCESLDIDFSGASEGVILGNTSELEIEASGASHINCERLIANNVSADASGASSISLSARKYIRIDASGASKVNYISNGATVEIESSGASNVTKKK
ncbi:MAG: hypothetical protein DRI84_05065 [Bacteroidetes bacterium]|nr:MAG: hypothetical protein DRI84_05065 [Bacteroidota bacterium]